MARSFNGSTDYFTSSVPNQGGVVSLAAWVYVDDLSVGREVISNYNAAGDCVQYDLSVRTDGGVEFLVQSSGGNYKLFDGPASAVSTGAWTQIGVSHDGLLNAEIFVGGVSQTITPTTAGSPIVPQSLFGNTSIGRLGSFNGGYFDGRIAEVGMWQGYLIAQEHASLAAGYAPSLISPNSLRHYWPLLARATAEEDWVGNAPMTRAGTPVSIDHPRVIYPTPRGHFFLPQTVGVASLPRKPLMVGQAPNRAATY